MEQRRLSLYLIDMKYIRNLAKGCIAPLNLRIAGKDDAAARNYKKMAAKQLDWCQHNRDAIVKRRISYM